MLIDNMKLDDGSPNRLGLNLVVNTLLHPVIRDGDTPRSMYTLNAQRLQQKEYSHRNDISIKGPLYYPKRVVRLSYSALTGQGDVMIDQNAITLSMAPKPQNFTSKTIKKAKIKRKYGRKFSQLVGELPEQVFINIKLSYIYTYIYAYIIHRYVYMCLCTFIYNYFNLLYLSQHPSAICLVPLQTHKTQIFLPNWVSVLRRQSYDVTNCNFVQDNIHFSGRNSLFARKMAPSSKPHRASTRYCSARYV